MKKLNWLIILVIVVAVLIGVWIVRPHGEPAAPVSPSAGLPPVPIPPPGQLAPVADVPPPPPPDPAKLQKPSKKKAHHR